MQGPDDDVVIIPGQMDLLEVAGAPRWEPLPPAIQELLDAVADQPHANDRATICAAIAAAADPQGRVSQNTVRALLRAPAGGGLAVTPQAVGATYSALARSGQIRAVGWEVSDDVQGRNSGKPCRVYQWLVRVPDPRSFGVPVPSGSAG